MIDQDLLTELQYALLEPPDGGQSWPSEVWTREEVLGEVNSSIWTWLRDTQGIVVRVELPVLAVSNGLVTLPTDWLATAHAVWRAADGTRTPLGPADRFEADHGVPTWQTAPATPLAWNDYEGETLTCQLIPAPDADGVLELLYVQRPADLLGAGATIPIPDEFLDAVKYGALATLLRKIGRLADPERASYGERRVQLTVVVSEILLGGFA